MSTEKSALEILHGPKRLVVGTVGDYTMQTRAEIPGQWNAFFAAKYDIPNSVPGAMYGVSFAADGQGGFRYAVGLEVRAVAGPLPEGLCEITLSEGDYAVLRAFGPVSELPANFDWMFAEWLPASAYELREGAVFERYPDDERNSADTMAYEIWLPVTAKSAA